MFERRSNQLALLRSGSRRRCSLGALFLSLSLGLTGGCDFFKESDKKLSFDGTDITGASFASNFSLTDHTGQVRTLADYANKVVVVFFGFTQCPDVCPGAMLEMKEVRNKLGAAAADVQVLFITVDPERDTQELLAQYVPGFDASFVGLRGDMEQTKRVTREFKVYFGKVPGSTPNSYTVDHTSASYVFDRSGKVRLMIRPGMGPEKIANDIKALLGA